MRTSRLRVLPWLCAASLLPAQIPAAPTPPAANPPAAATAPTRPPFAPREHGFRFANTFENDAVPLLDLRTGGLCGGMVYAALDYWHAGSEVPPQDYRPANGTPLQRYIYSRQVESLVKNGPRWIQLFADVRGARREQFFRCGLDRGAQGELGILLAALADGAPVPLGLKSPGRGGHQVLALGCEVGEREQDVVIRLYDPNYPGRTMRMVPDLEQRRFVYENGPKHVQWAAWFVDVHYSPKVPTVAAAPPWPVDGLVHELLVECVIGGRDLAGRGEDLDAVLQFRDGRKVTFTAINLGARWLGDYRETARLVLSPPVAAPELQALELRLAAAAASDGCELRKVRVYGLGGELRVGLGDAKRTALSPAAPTVLVPFGPLK